MIPSVSSYSFAQYVNAGKMTLLDTVAKAKELGFTAIEFDELHIPDLEERKALARTLRAEADRLGMVIPAYSVSGNLYLNDPEADAKELARVMGQVEVAEILGAKVMRHDVVYQIFKTGKCRSFDQMLPHIAAQTRKITEYAASKGIRTCTENHGYIAQDSDRMERLFAAVDHENYGLLVDIGNFCCADEDSAHAVSRVAPMAIHAHAKDMHLCKDPAPGFSQTRGCNYFKGAILGEGDIDIARCIAILKRAGYDGYISIEFEGAEDCIEGISKGLAYLNTLI